MAIVFYIMDISCNCTNRQFKTLLDPTIQARIFLPPTYNLEPSFYLFLSFGASLLLMNANLTKEDTNLIKVWLEDILDSLHLH
jgi:hypothetical protein